MVLYIFSMCCNVNVMKRFVQKNSSACIYLQASLDLSNMATELPYDPEANAASMYTCLPYSEGALLAVGFIHVMLLM